MSALIVSLSTIPPRFDKLGPTLDSLLAQSHAPDAIELHIPRRYRRFPDWDGRLPALPRGVEIRRSEDDWGPATKVLSAARDHAGAGADIVFCDDDRVYGPGFLADLVATRAQHQDCAIANLGFLAEEIVPCTGAGRPEPAVVRSWRITDLDFQGRFLWKQIKAGRRWREVSGPWRRVYKRSGFVDVFEGCGGVMVRPEFFDAAFYDIPAVLWTVDDIWLSGQLRRKGVGIWLRGNQFPPRETEARHSAPLVKSVVDGADRETANRMAAEYFQRTHGVWL